TPSAHVGHTPTLRQPSCRWSLLSWTPCKAPISAAPAGTLFELTKGVSLAAGPFGVLRLAARGRLVRRRALRAARVKTQAGAGRGQTQIAMAGCDAARSRAWCTCGRMRRAGSAALARVSTLTSRTPAHPPYAPTRGACTPG